MDSFIIWEPNPIAVDFGVLRISWYGLTWSLSIIVAYFLTKAIFNKEHKDEEHTTIFVQYVFFGAMIGARVFDVLYYHFDAFIARPMLMFEIMNGGLASHGAILGVCLALLLFTRKYKYDFVWCVDRVALVMPLLGGFVRIGNLINSELYGKVSTVPWAFVFPLSDPLTMPRHPVQIYEALWLFACFALFWTLYKKGYSRKGFFTGLFLSLVLGGRFLIEFFKDTSTYYGPFSNTQWLSILAAVIGIGILFKSRKTA